MGKKYIIELLDDCQSEFKGIIGFGLTPSNQISTEPIPVEDLTPYTEPDMEQVKADVWECARKICAMDSRTRDEIFGEEITQDILEHYSASEAIEKIRQYEHEKEEQIKVGDEVEMKCGLRAICSNTDNLGMGLIVLIFEDGSTGEHRIDEVKGNTGRHFPEIAEVLKKMGEGQEQ